MPALRRLVSVLGVAVATATLAGPAASGYADTDISAPTDLQASFVQWHHGADRIHLSWTSPAESFDHMVVMFGQTPTPAVSIAQVDPATTSIDLDVPSRPGDVASFRVYAVRDSDGSRSPSSNLVVVSDLPLGPQLQVTPVSGVAGRVALSWPAPGPGDQVVLRQVTNSPDVLTDGLPIVVADPTSAGTVVQDIGSATRSPSYALFEQSIADPDQVSPASVASSAPAPKPLTGLSLSIGSDPTSLLVQWGLPSGCPAPGYQVLHCLEARVAVAEGTTAPTSPTDGMVVAPPVDGPAIENFGTTLAGLVPGHTYSVSVFNTYGNPESYSPGISHTIVFKDSPILSVTGTPPTLVTYGTTVTVRGTVIRNSSRAPLAGLATSLGSAHSTSDAAGRVSFTLRPATSATYEIAGSGTTELWAGSSPSFDIAVRPVISLGLSHSTVRHGSTVTAAGTISPHLRTRLVLQRYSGGAWHSITAVTSTTTGHYSLHIRTSAKGTTSYRVVRSGDRTLATGVSRTVRLTAT